MKFLGEVVVVSIIEEKDISEGGIHLPETRDQHATRTVRGIVKYIGWKVEKDLLKVGDVVLVPQHLGTRLEIKKQKLVVYDLEDVKAVETTTKE